MNALFVYPLYPETFWSFSHALKFIGKKAAFPPLGLLTVAAMTPDRWEKRLVDMNVRSLTDKDIAWADCVFISAMTVQKRSVRDILARCRRAGVRTVAGGPLFTSSPEEFEEADHLVLGEAEVSLPPLLYDLEKGRARRIYSADRFADLNDTPVPLLELINRGDYAAMNIQYSRGCPFSCDFCDITQLFGRRPRTKGTDRLLVELDALYSLGWRGGVFFVDDNFIGDRRKLVGEVLPAMVAWQKERRYPFSFFTEASIDLSDHPDVMGLMVESGFEEVFVGIETPDDGGLSESGKVQNKNRNLIASVKRIQQAGLQVQAGFIVGFDSDPPSIFEKQIRFIQESGIVTAMVGMLTPLRGTRLHQRLYREGRLVDEPTGNNTSFSLAFVPNMGMETLIEGYLTILSSIYSPGNYYRRLISFLREYRPFRGGHVRLKGVYMKALFRSMVVLGVIGKERFHYWRLFFWSLLRRPELFPLAISLSIYGFHFRKISERIILGGLPERGSVK